mmetsp:Transcript_71777/g.153425  ORF Transcript_71777/g.153425 Transcript_71777/m.153425 type:complete len:200 (+) Transcript_71777:1015-1614(+)
MMSEHTSRRSLQASRNSWSKRREAAAVWSLVNSWLPRCWRRQSSMCCRLEASPRDRCNATNVSTSTNSSCDDAAVPCRRSASTAATAPSCTQIQSGKCRLVLPRTTGRKSSSRRCRREASERVFTSSKISAMNFTGPLHSASTAGTSRWCNAANKGVLASSVSTLTSALAWSNVLMPSTTLSLALSLQFIAKRLSPVEP